MHRLISSLQGGLLATRFCLGIVEAPYCESRARPRSWTISDPSSADPGALYILSSFYSRTEVATRIAVLYTGNILATAFAGLIAAGIFELDGVLGYAGWQWLFIIQGSVTGLVALCAYPFLPNTPGTTRWLTPAEREMAVNRLLRDQVDQDAEQGSALAGLKQAVRDPRVWLFCLMQNLHLSANGFKNFFPSVVNTLGFSRLITLV